MNTEPAPTRLLLVDDEPSLREPLAEYLTRQGFVVRQAEDAAKARSALLEDTPDLVLLDIMMPGEDGLSLCRHLAETKHLPVIMLTARGEAMDRIVGLEIGADDYVSKPFDPRELLARIRSVLRRTAQAPAEEGAGNPETAQPGRRVRMGRCVLDLAAHRLIDEHGNDVPITPLEFDLLKAFAEHPNEALSRDRILNLSQQRDWDPFDRSVDLRVMRVRKKIEPDPQRPQFIRTVRNAGYVFVADGGREK